MTRRLAGIDSILTEGTCVVSAKDDVIFRIINDAVENGISVTFYVTQQTSAAFSAWYWTAGRREEAGVEDISPEEQARIGKELGLKDLLTFSNRIPCEKCGEVYGAFEFLQQGINEHGRALVDGVMSLTNGALIRVNPTESPICPNCRLRIIDHEVPHHYGGGKYAGCCSGGKLQ